MIGVLVLVGAARAESPDCTDRGQVADLDRAVGRAEIAIQSLDATSLQAALAESEVDLACLREPLGPHHVALWFRAAGIEAVGRDPARAVALLRAARTLEPGYRLNPDLGPPIQAAYAEAEPSTDPTVPLPPPTDGWVAVNGGTTDAAPRAGPFVVQWFGADGAVRFSGVLQAGAPVPWPIARPPPAPTPVLAVEPIPLVVPPPPSRSHPSRVLALSGLASGVVAGAGIAWAGALKADIVDAAPDVPGSLLATNRGVGYGAGGLGLVAVGLGVGAVVVGRW